MRCTFFIFALALATALTPCATGQDKRRQKEQATQVLELPKEPPPAVVAEAGRLVFEVTPLSAKGLLSQQLRGALKWVLRQDRAVVRLRAFVAGTGDARRVQAIVSEIFTDKHQPLPVLSVVQIGALPLEGAQVVLEAVLAERKTVNPNGLAFFTAQSAYVERPLEPVAPLAGKALEQLAGEVRTASAEPAGVLHVSCSLTSLEGAAEVRALALKQFPRAALNLVQPLRGALQSGASCEAVARLSTAPAKSASFLGGVVGPTHGHSKAVLIAPGRVAFTGAQLAFGATEPDARLAFERLGKSLEQVKASFHTAAVVHVYALSRSIAEQAQKVGATFFGPQPPAVTALPFEGLPSMDASFSVDVIALVPE